MACAPTTVTASQLLFIPTVYLCIRNGPFTIVYSSTIVYNSTIVLVIHFNTFVNYVAFQGREPFFYNNPNSLIQSSSRTQAAQVSHLAMEPMPASIGYETTGLRRTTHRVITLPILESNDVVAHKLWNKSLLNSCKGNGMTWLLTNVLHKMSIERELRVAAENTAARGDRQGAALFATTTTPTPQGWPRRTHSIWHSQARP